MFEPTKYHYLFYDFETTGQNPCFDQPVRLAVIETDYQFNIIKKHNINIKLRNDILPHPKALLVNKLSIPFLFALTKFSLDVVCLISTPFLL